MSQDAFHLNRPVHLARRDAFYEKAVGLIRGLSALETLPAKRRQAEKALYLLNESRRHARAANLSGKTSRQNRLFVDFLDMVVDNTESIARLLRRRLSMDGAGNPLDRFLGNAEAGIKMDAHFRQCTAHILKGVLLLIRQAEQPIQNLRQTSIAKMSAANRARYDRARTHFMAQACDEAEQTIVETSDL